MSFQRQDFVSLTDQAKVGFKATVWRDLRFHQARRALDAVSVTSLASVCSILMCRNDVVDAFLAHRVPAVEKLRFVEDGEADRTLQRQGQVRVVEGHF